MVFEKREAGFQIAEQKSKNGPHRQQVKEDAPFLSLPFVCATVTFLASSVSKDLAAAKIGKCKSLPTDTCDVNKKHGPHKYRLKWSTRTLNWNSLDFADY
jgi:hypothetical protein